MSFFPKHQPLASESIRVCAVHFPKHQPLASKSVGVCAFHCPKHQLLAFKFVDIYTFHFPKHMRATHKRRKNSIHLNPKQDVLEETEKVKSLQWRKDKTSNASLRHAGGVRRAERRCEGYDVSCCEAREGDRRVVFPRHWPADCGMPVGGVVFWEKTCYMKR